MKKNPILVFTGLAVAAVAVIAGLTRDRWMQPAPQTVTAVETAQAPENPVKTEAPQISVPAAEPPAPAAAKTPAAPTFDTVRVEKNGEAIIAGRAEAGSEVVVKLDGETVGKATANAEGSFVVVPEQPLPAGSGALTIESKGRTEAAATKSEQTVAVIVPERGKQDALVAVVSPNEPTKVLQKPEPEKTAETETAAAPAATAEEPAASVQPEPPAAAPRQISLDAVDYDSTGNIVFSGRGEPGLGARIYVDNNFTGDAGIGADGRWSFSGTTGVTAGVHALRVDGVDGKGKVINRIEVPFFREDTTRVAIAETTAPAQAATGAAAKSTTETSRQQAAATATETPTAAPGTPKEGRVVIQPGNNLWRISRVIYGSGLKYTLLYEANKDQIRNPNLIYPGQVFKTPDVVPPESIDPKRHEPLQPEESAASAQ